jgi:oligopeptidase B
MTESSGCAPPRAERHPHIEHRHGEACFDPYFWLREKDSLAVREYLEAENEYTAAMTRELAPLADTIYSEMLARIKQTDLSVPQRRGAYYYYSRTVEGLQYPIYCRRASLPDGSDDAAAAEQILLDQNQLAEGKAFLAIGDFELTERGDRLAYSVDETGFRQYTLFVKDLATGSVSDPVAERVTSVAWAADGETIFYCTEDPITKRSDRLWRRDPGAAAVQLFHEADPLFRIGVGTTRDRQFVLFGCYSTDTWEQWLIPAGAPRQSARCLLPRQKGHKYDADHRAGRLYIRTNMEAKDFRVVVAPLEDPAPQHWSNWIEHSAGTLIKSVGLFRDHAVVTVKSEGLIRFRVHEFATGAWHEIEFPEAVYTASAAENPEFSSDLFRFSYQSMVTPVSIYDYRIAARTRVLLKQQEVLGGYTPEHYRCERLWAVAPDGVRIPISILLRHDRPRDNRGPLLLYGYGSYGLGMSASFLSTRLSLVDRGFAFAVAHIRGGDELGESWHDHGMLLHKRNTFTDFIACAESLITADWTSPQQLAIQGGSAGGLLVGAVLNFRPDLFAAAHAAVPFVDVINTMWDESLPLTVGEFLEWGNPKDLLSYVYIKSYSPYDNLEAKDYPPILVTTSWHDSQVMYWEPAKWVAKLRWLKTDGNPLLLKTHMQSGHGGASGRYDKLRDVAFEYAWIIDQLTRADKRPRKK